MYHLMNFKFHSAFFIISREMELIMFYSLKVSKMIISQQYESQYNKLNHFLNLKKSKER